MRAWWMKVRIWLAFRLVRGTPYGVYLVERLANSLGAMQEARNKVIHSGHLNRAYNVGTQLRKILTKAIVEHMES